MIHWLKSLTSKTALAGCLAGLVPLGAHAQSCYPRPSGLVAFWPGDAVPNDIVGGHNGTLEGSAGYAAGEVGQAFSLDGSSGFVQVPDDPAWAFGTNAFTVELWASFASAGGRQAFVASDDGGGSQNKWIFWLDNGNLTFHINGAAYTDLGVIPFTPTAGTWYHLAVTRQGSLFSFYTNGVAAGASTLDIVVPDAAQPLTLGRAEGQFYFGGLLDEVSIYNRALSGPEIQAIYTAGSNGKCKPPFILSASPAAGTQAVPTNASISMAFSVPLNPATLTTNVVLQDALGSLVPGTVSYFSASNTAVFQPAAALNNLAVYTVTVTTNVLDATGNALALNNTWTFTTLSAWTGNIHAAGHIDHFTFTGTTGQRLFYDTLNLTNYSVAVTITAPSGATVFSQGAYADGGPFYLPETGVYNLSVSASSDSFSDYSFRLIDTATTPTISLGNTNGVVLNPSSKTEIRQFTATAGMRVALDMLTNTSSSAGWQLIDPANQVIRESGTAYDLGTNLLNLPGTYLVVVSGRADETPVNFAFRVRDVSDPPVVPTALDNTITGTVAAGATNVALTFQGNAGTPVYYDALVPGGAGDTTAQIVMPDGTLLMNNNASYDNGPWYLPQTGTYQVWMIGSSGGDYAFRLQNLNNAPLAGFGAAQACRLPPNGRQWYRLAVQAGQQLYHDQLFNAFPTWSLSYTYYSPTLNYYISDGAGYDYSAFTPPVPGTNYVTFNNATTDQTLTNHFEILSRDQLPTTGIHFNVNYTNTLVDGYAMQLYRFTGTNGQRLFMDLLGADSSANWYVYDPVNGQIASGNTLQNVEFTLSHTGLHTLMIQGQGTSNVLYDFNLRAPAEMTNALSLAVVYSGFLTNAGDRHNFVFNGQVGQRLYYDPLLTDSSNIVVRLYNPRGEIVFINNNYNDANIPPFTLTESGNYTLSIGGASEVCWGYQFRLLDLNQAPVTSLTYGTTCNLTNDPGTLSGVFRLPAAASQRLYLNLLSSIAGQGVIKMFDQNNNWVVYNVNYDLDFVNSTASGTNILVVKGTQTNALPVAFRVLAPAQVNAGTLAFNTIVSNYFTSGGQDVVFTVNFTTGDRFYYDGLDDSGASITAQLLDPAGNSVFYSNQDANSGLMTALASGAYKLILHNGTAGTPKYHFTVWRLADQTPLALGSTTPDQLTLGMQSRLYPFTATAGQRIAISFPACSSPYQAVWQLVTPNNTVVNSSYLTTDRVTNLLSVSGTYAIVVAGQAPATTMINYSLTLAPVTQTTMAAAGFGTHAGNIAAGGTNVFYFNASAGAAIYLASLTNNNSAYVSLFDTNGANFLYNWSASAGTADSGLIVVPTSGTCRGEITAYQSGDYAFRLMNLDGGDVTDAGFGTNLAGITTTAFETRIFRVNTTAGQRFIYDALENDLNWMANWVFARDGSTLWGCNGGCQNADSDTPILTSSQNGIYYFALKDGTGTNNHYSFRLLDLNQGTLFTTNVQVGAPLALVPAYSLSVTGTYLPQTGVYDWDFQTNGLATGTRTDSLINFSNSTWGALADVGFTSAQGSDTNWWNFSVQWDGTIAITNPTCLYLSSLSGSRMWIDINQDGQFDTNELIDNYYSASGGTSPASPRLTNGVYPIRIQYMNNRSGGDGYITLLQDRGTNVAPLGEQVFRFTSSPRKLFFDSRLTSGNANWYVYSAYSASALAGNGGLNDFEAATTVGGTNYLIINNGAVTAQPYAFAVITPVETTNTLTLNAITNLVLAPGERHDYTFAGSAGQRLFYNDLQPVTYSYYVGTKLTAPSGMTSVSGSYGQNFGPVYLTENGTYTLEIENHTDQVVTNLFRLLDVTAPPVLAFDVTNTVVASNGCQAVVYLVRQPAGMELYYNQLATGPYSYFYLPNNTLNTWNYPNGDLTLWPASGSQTWLLVLTQPYDATAYTNYFSLVPENHAPVPPSVPGQTVNELTVLTVTNPATDPDAPNDTLTYALLSAPAGMVIDGAGSITWTPAQTQSPATNTIVVGVTDNGTPPLSATNSFTVVVKEVNTAPTLPAQTNVTVNELTPLTVVNIATNANIHSTNYGYTLVNPPSGMAISASGVITWTPTQAQSPGTNLITTVVTNGNPYDLVNPHLASTNTFTVIVREVNTAPTLPTQTNTTVNELTLLTVTNTAGESNVHSTLGYALVSPPAGAGINASGIITWTPTQTQSPGTNVFTTIVTNSNPYDLTNPHLSATNSFTVVVKEVNVAPSLPVQTNVTVNELTLLTVANTATNANIHSTNFGYGLVNPPSGMTINASGIITWTPNQAQSPGTNLITTVVTNGNPYDLVNPHLASTNTFTVIVREVNTAPTLPAQTNVTVNELTLLTVANTATNANIHSTNYGYTLVNPPSGMAISAGGVITWTPTQAQSPGTNLITTVVTNGNPYDLANPHLTTTNTFTVIVREVNTAPTLPTQTNTTVNELTLLTVTNTAGEFNVHSTLGYALVSPPAGASISASGIITWTPTQTQSPGTNVFTTIVTNSNPYDLTNPHLSATNSFTVLVKEVNVAPSLPVQTNITVNELTLLTVANTATNANIHSTNFGYGLVNPPSGMTISASGVITWTPTQAQSPGTNLITTVVTNGNPYDLVNPRLASTNTFTVIVREVNAAPVLPLITSKAMHATTTLYVTNTATETNIHATVTYRLVNPPTGLNISTNGVIGWTPSTNQAPSTNLVTTIATSTDSWDAINPVLTATNTFTIIVQPVVTLTVSPTITGGIFRFSFNTVLNGNYELDYSTNLTSWSIARTVVGDGNPFTLNDSNAVKNTEGFYRIKIVP